MVRISIRITETGLGTTGGSFQPVVPSYFSAVKEQHSHLAGVLRLRAQPGACEDSGSPLLALPESQGCSRRGVHWLFQTMFPFSVLRAHRNTTEHKIQVIRTGSPGARRALGAPGASLVCGWLCVTKAKYFPHPLFLWCSSSCSNFSQQLAWGTPGVASSFCGQVSFLPWASPKAMVIGSVGTHTRHLYADHSSGENGDPGFPADICNEERWATGFSQKHGQV